MKRRPIRSRLLSLAIIAIVLSIAFPEGDTEWVKVPEAEEIFIDRFFVAPPGTWVDSVDEVVDTWLAGE